MNGEDAQHDLRLACKARKRTKAGVYAMDIKLEELQKYFHLVSTLALHTACVRSTLSYQAHGRVA